MLQKNNFSTIVQTYMCYVQILSFLWYIPEKQIVSKTQHTFWNAVIFLEKNAVAGDLWVSEGSEDFKSVVHSTEGTSGQKPIY